LMDCFGTAISMSLQYGVPLEVLVNKFSHTRFEPMGFTTNPDIRIAKSVVDYIFRWIGQTFQPAPEVEAPTEESLDESDTSEATPSTTTTSTPAPTLNTKPSTNGHSETAVQSEPKVIDSEAPACDNCGSITIRNGNCYLCHNCGNSLGCS